MKEICTIGYSGSTLPMVLSILKTYGITDLIDIRRYNYSWLSSFEGGILAALLPKYGINYQQEKRLAPSVKLLRSYKNNDISISEFKQKYLEAIGEEGLKIAINLFEQKERPCILCSEEYANLEFCHRKMLCDTIHSLNSDKGYNFIHLREWDFSGEKLREMELWRGGIYNLLDRFEGISKKYFSHAIKNDRILLLWENIPKRPKGLCLGFFRPPNYIAINKLLDKETVPVEFLDSVLYHELLHYKMLRAGKNHGHTEEFYYEYFAFEDYAKIFGFKVEKVETVISTLKEIRETQEEDSNDVSFTT